MGSVQEAPADLAALAHALGIGKAQMRKLTAQHGEALIPHLQGEWKRKCVEKPRLLARRSHMGYVDNPAEAQRRGDEAGAELEAVSEDDQRRFTEESRRRFGVLRAEEKAKAETRSRVNRLRELETRARNKGISLDANLQAIEVQMRRMEQAVAVAA